MDFLDKYSAQILGIVRIVGGLLFLSFGIAKLFHFPVVPMFTTVKPTDFPEGIAGCIELVTGALMLVGFYSRIAAFIASGEMAVAYFMAHFPNSPYPAVNGGTAAILFCFIFLYLAAGGPGSFALNRK